MSTTIEMALTTYAASGKSFRNRIEILDYGANPVRLEVGDLVSVTGQVSADVYSGRDKTPRAKIVIRGRPEIVALPSQQAGTDSPEDDGNAPEQPAAPRPPRPASNVPREDDDVPF